MTTSVEHQYKEMTVDTASSPPKMAGNPIAGFLFQVAMLSSLLCSSNGHGLKMGFYKQSCPQAETIVRTTVDSFFSHDPTVSAPLLRLHFHDCFVRGCDGSVLLNSTRKNLAEKDAKPNLTLDGFYVIDAAKAALEESCPATVSCADILALAARDAVSLAAGLGKGIAMTNQSLYQVETGRRDGFVSRASEAEAHLPSSYANISALKANFGSKRLTARDLAILSGAHAIGNSHCFSFDKRLKRYHGKGGIDPTLDPHYAIKLISKCRPSNGTTTEMVPGSSTTFDTKYYELVAKRRGLFHSDAALLHDKVTRDYVFSRLKSPESSFFADFGSAMVKMGKVGVLTGKAGEIRKNCALVNR
ncbi:peroxidase 56 [Musa acuminata AAA Group]|uniref:peroxidase 56 n=1 Tax=Musa acuminata AAA Group TaxID=214697 RepID=UPI0031D70472